MRDFFAGCKIADIFLVLNSAGRASGEGFIKFETAEDGARALMRDRDLMIKRYVEVSPRKLVPRAFEARLAALPLDASLEEGSC